MRLRNIWDAVKPTVQGISERLATPAGVTATLATLAALASFDPKITVPHFDQAVIVAVATVFQALNGYLTHTKRLAVPTPTQALTDASQLTAPGVTSAGREQTGLALVQADLVPTPVPQPVPQPVPVVNPPPPADRSTATALSVPTSVSVPGALPLYDQGGPGLAS